MNSDLLTKFKIEFADSRPKEFAVFLSSSSSDNAKELLAEALSFYLSHNGSVDKSLVQTINSPIIHSDPINYNPFLSWVEKITIAINETGAPATTTEIVDFILSHEPKLDRKKVAIGVSVTLSRTKGKKFAQLDNNGRGFAYSLINSNKITKGNFKNSTSTNKTVVVFDDGDYNLNWSWIDKIKYFIDLCGGLATTNELNQKLILHEGIQDKATKKKKIASMSSILSQNSKDGGIFTREQKNGDSIYGINKGR